MPPVHVCRPHPIGDEPAPLGCDHACGPLERHPAVGEVAGSIQQEHGIKSLAQRVHHAGGVLCRNLPDKVNRASHLDTMVKVGYRSFTLPIEAGGFAGANVPSLLVKSHLELVDHPPHGGHGDGLRRPSRRPPQRASAAVYRLEQPGGPEE